MSATPRNSLAQRPGDLRAVQPELAGLRLEKAALDEIIACQSIFSGGTCTPGPDRKPFTSDEIAAFRSLSQTAPIPVEAASHHGGHGLCLRIPGTNYVTLLSRRDETVTLFAGVLGAPDDEMFFDLLPNFASALETVADSVFTITAALVGAEHTPQTDTKH